MAKDIWVHFQTCWITQCWWWEGSENMWTLQLFQELEAILDLFFVHCTRRKKSKFLSTLVKPCEMIFPFKGKSSTLPKIIFPRILSIHLRHFNFWPHHHGFDLEHIHWEKGGSCYPLAIYCNLRNISFYMIWHAPLSQVWKMEGELATQNLFKSCLNREKKTCRIEWSFR